MGGLRERKKEQTRARLMEAALRLFRERGYEGSTVELIASEADVSVTTFFRYFESKEDVFLASARAAWERFDRAIRERPPGEPVLRALRTVVSEVIAEFTGEGSDRAELKQFEAVPELHERMREYDADAQQLIAKAFAEELGVDAADLPAQMLAGALMGAFSTARATWLKGPRRGSLHDHMMRAFDVFEEMARPILTARR